MLCAQCQRHQQTRVSVLRHLPAGRCCIRFQHDSHISLPISKPPGVGEPCRDALWTITLLSLHTHIIPFRSQRLLLETEPLTETLMDLIFNQDYLQLPANIWLQMKPFKSYALIPKAVRIKRTHLSFKISFFKLKNVLSESSLCLWIHIVSSLKNECRKCLF